MRRVFERLYDEIKLLRWRMRGVIASRPRVALIALALTVIVAGLVYWQRGSEFRANEDILGSGDIEYIGESTSEEFLSALAVLPEERIDAYRSIALFTELSSANYFSQPTAAKRAAVLAASALPENEKQLVAELENSSGNNAFVENLNEQACQPGEMGWLKLISEAHAEDGDWCIGQTLAHIDALRKTNTDPGLVDFAVAFDHLGLWATMAGAGRPECDGGGTHLPYYQYNYFIKSCWSAEGLDELYNKYWPDRKSSRNKNRFEGIEVKRIQSNIELFHVINLPVEQWGDRLINARIEVASTYLMWADVVGKVIQIPLKVGLKSVAINGTTRLVRPAAVATVKFLPRTSVIFHDIANGILAGRRVNVTQLFSRSTLSIEGKTALKIGTSGLNVSRVAASEAGNALNDLSRSRFTSNWINGDLAATLLDKTRYVKSNVVFNFLDNRKLSFKGSYLGMADTATKQTYINEAPIRLLLKKAGASEETVRAGLRLTSIHEYLHQLTSVGTFPYSKILKYSPVDEGFTEWTTRQIARERGIPLPSRGSYDHEVAVISEVFEAFQRISGKKGQAAVAAAEKSMMTAYSYGSRNLDVAFNGRIVPNSSLARGIEQSGGLAEWMTKEMEKGNYNTVINYLEAYIQ